MNTRASNVHVHHGDLPSDVSFGNSVAIDTETMGLNPHRDRLCLVQLSSGDGSSHLVKMSTESPSGGTSGGQNAPNLRAILEDDAILKLFHFARFDVGVFYKHLNVVCQPIYCTKIASKLVRTYTDRHGLKELCRELIGVELSKEQQSSDWGREDLSEDQLRYAANDVLYLHRLKQVLDGMLAREGRRELAESCFRFLPTRSVLDIEGWPDTDILAY